MTRKQPYARTLVEAERKMMADSIKVQPGRPHPYDIRGRCPECGEDLISNLYYFRPVEGETEGGYVLVWECWGQFADPPTCGYRKRLD